MTYVSLTIILWYLDMYCVRVEFWQAYVQYGVYVSHGGSCGAPVVVQSSSKEGMHMLLRLYVSLFFFFFFQSRNPAPGLLPWQGGPLCRCPGLHTSYRTSFSWPFTHPVPHRGLPIPAPLSFSRLSPLPPFLAPLFNEVDFLLSPVFSCYLLLPSPFLIHLFPGAPPSTPSLPLDAPEYCMGPRLYCPSSTAAVLEVLFPNLFHYMCLSQ